MLHDFFPTSQTYWYIPGSPGHERNQVMKLSSGYSTEFHKIVVYSIGKFYGRKISRNPPFMSQ